MKLFIAFHLADTTRDRCVRVQRDLFERVGRAATTILRPVPAEKMHITAVFIGEVDRRTTDQIGAVFHDCIASLRGVGRSGMESGGTAHLPSLSIGGVGAFPSIRRPRVVWVEAADPRGVVDEWVRGLRVALSGGAAALRLDIDSRRFVPHVTIAYPRRRLNRDQRRALESALISGAEANDAADVVAGSVTPIDRLSAPEPVPRIAVVESISTGQGTRYEDLFWIDL